MPNHSVATHLNDQAKWKNIAIPGRIVFCKEYSFGMLQLHHKRAGSLLPLPPDRMEDARRISGAGWKKGEADMGPKAEKAACPGLSLWKDSENGVSLPGSPRYSVG